ncbi:hypothetical protein [Polyangium fumosum]|uniref:Uncharacterized protein n=1 Tax=Polyangium fumosum TaxID=889272 RepID=A0A4U1IWU4_9BACT|nr:hypothetical protein [Polyangium fumosum]TKC98928.1 hypothetical protein E8A74_39735 [Polyangium fumosum]
MQRNVHPSLASVVPFPPPAISATLQAEARRRRNQVDDNPPNGRKLPALAERGTSSSHGFASRTQTGESTTTSPASGAPRQSRAARSTRPKRASGDGARASPGMARLEASPPPHWHFQID